MAHTVVTLVLVLLASPASAQAVLTGRVIAGGTGAPVAGARVDVAALGGAVMVTTDGEGRFVLGGLPPGRHTLRVVADGFQPVMADFSVTGANALTLEVPMAPALAHHEERVHVTASRDARRPGDLPYATSTVDREELDRRMPRTTPEALMDSPGMLLQKTSHGSGSPYLRGLVGNQVLVLVDGIRLNNSTFRYGPNQYLATIDPGQIERIEIVRGAGAVLYGSDAIGGVINIITKRPALTLGPQRFDAGFAGRVMTHGQEQSGRVEVAGGGSRLAARAGFSGRNFGDLRAGGSLGVESPSGYADASADASALIRATDRSLISVSYQHLRQDDVPRFDQVTQRGFDRYSFDPQVRQLGAVTLTHTPGGGAIRSLESTLSFQHTFERRELQRAASSTRTIEEDTVGTIGWSTQAAFVPWHGWALQAGVDVHSDRIDSARRDEHVITGASTSRRGLYPDGAGAGSVAGFVYGSRAWGRAALEGGVRYSRVDISAPDVTFGSIALEASAWTGQIGASYRATHWVQFVGSISQSFRAPNVDDVSTLGQFDSGIEVPSPNLVPERAWSVEGGARVRAGTLAVSGVLFRTTLNDLIDRVRSTFQGSDVYEGQPVFQKANVQRAYLHGAEIEGQWQAGDRLLIYGHASYTFGHQPTLDQPMRRIPPLNGLAAARWTQRADGLWIEGRLRGASMQTRLSDGDKSDHRINPNGTPGWAVVSFGAGRPLGSRVEITGAVENLFNEAYRVHGSGIDAAGRHAWLGMQVRF